MRATPDRRGSTFWQQQIRRVVLPTLGVGALAVATAAVATSPSADLPVGPDRVTVAASEVSRGGERPVLAAPAATAQQAAGALWVVDTTDIRSDAAPDAAVLGQAERGTQVLVTGVVEGDWTQVLYNDVPRWVTSGVLTAEEPLGTAACPRTPGVERGLQPDTIKVYRAVCEKFPEISTYGGRAARSNSSGHPTGRALDIMTSDKALGDQIAQFVIDNHTKLGATQVIWRQRIWEPGSGWRGMENRGGATANHMDHVHVTTSGDAATS
ncbi:SH3 domain-containing protein [Aeromicrobium alkaliterrae]|uniref:SH3 domain-containing protein n=1 Tax=Aeromicrobium alkaliterrae TaxID=302168 RepID=UPI0031D594AF